MVHNVIYYRQNLLESDSQLNLPSYRVQGISGPAECYKVLRKDIAPCSDVILDCMLYVFISSYTCSTQQPQIVKYSYRLTWSRHKGSFIVLNWHSLELIARFCWWGKLSIQLFAKAGTIGVGVFVPYVQLAWNNCKHECGKRGSIWKKKRLMAIFSY